MTTIEEVYDDIAVSYPVDAFDAFLDNHGVNQTDPEVLADTVEEFEESYRGEWPSFREYAEEFADEIGMFGGVDVAEMLERYFDWDKWTAELLHDYWLADAIEGGGVHVFANY